MGMLPLDQSWKRAQVKTQGSLELEEEGDKSRRKWVWILQRCSVNKLDRHTAKLQTCPGVSLSLLGWSCHQAGTRPLVAAPAKVPHTPNPLLGERGSTSEGSEQENRSKHCLEVQGTEMGMKASLRISPPAVPVGCEGRLKQDPEGRGISDPREDLGW